MCWRCRTSPRTALTRSPSSRRRARSTPTRLLGPTGTRTDDVLESMIQDYDGYADDQELAEAYATILQKTQAATHREQGTWTRAKLPLQRKGRGGAGPAGQGTPPQCRKVPEVCYSLLCVWEKGALGRRSGVPASRSAASQEQLPGQEEGGTFQEALVFHLLRRRRLPAGGRPGARLTSSWSAPSGPLTTAFEMKGKQNEAYMILRADDLCEHSSYKGGQEAISPDGQRALATDHVQGARV